MEGIRKIRMGGSMQASEQQELFQRLGETVQERIALHSGSVCCTDDRTTGVIEASEDVGSHMLAGDEQLGCTNADTMAEAVRECGANDAPQNQAQKASTRLLMELIEQQDYQCATCGIELTPDAAHLDHRLPRSRGGSDLIDNLQWMCSDCNKAKGSMTSDEFIAMCMRVHHAHPP